MRSILLLFFLSIYSTIAVANSPVNFGLNFRLNIPRTTLESNDWNQIWSDVQNSPSNLQNIVEESNIGHAGGIFLRFNKGRGFLHTEAVFSFNSSGFTALEETTLDETHYTSESTVFRMPLYLGCNLVDAPIFKIRMFTGPQFAWLVDAEATYTISNTGLTDVSSEFDVDEFTWLWSIGAGFELFMFSFDARYGFDIKGIKEVSDLEQSFSQKINIVEFTLGFKFI